MQTHPKGWGAEAPPAPTPQPAPRPEQPARQPEQRQRRPRRPAHGEDDKPVKAFGDHMPEFLRHPVQLPPGLRKKADAA